MTPADSPPRLVIGLGSGRSGSVSLSRLLSAQPGMTVRHEGQLDGRYHIFRWEGDEARIAEWVARLARRARDEGDSHFGDVAAYYLPYVEGLLAGHAGARFVCLERERAQVVRSFLLKTRGTHHWLDHDGSRWRAHPFDACFPKLPEPDKARAIGRYWDLYAARIRELQAAHPEAVGLFPLSSLNSRDGRDRILDFIGYEGTRRLDGRFHENRTHLRRRLRWVVDRLVGADRGR